MKNPTQNQSAQLTSLFLSESSVLAYVVAQVSSVQDVHHQVQVLSVLESVVHVDYERVVQLRENLAFVHD